MIFQIDDCRDLSSLFYMLPFQRGYLVNWEHQKTVWDYVYGKTCLNFDPSTKDLIFTEPYFNFGSIQEGLSEMHFEEYRFKARTSVSHDVTTTSLIQQVVSASRAFFVQLQQIWHVTKTRLKGRTSIAAWSSTPDSASLTSCPSSTARESEKPWSGSTSVANYSLIISKKSSRIDNSTSWTRPTS